VFTLAVYDSSENAEGYWEEKYANAITVDDVDVQIESDNPDFQSLGNRAMAYSIEIKAEGVNGNPKVAMVQEGKLFYFWLTGYLGRVIDTQWEAFLDFVIAGSANIKDDQDNYTREELFAMIPGEGNLDNLLAMNAGEADLPEEWTFDPEEDEYLEADA
jgi:hypothetical protein